MRREPVRRRIPGVGQETFGRPAEHVLGEQAGVEIRFGRRDAGFTQPHAGRRYLRMNAHETAVASLSFSDW
jgi:hypothetical protein